MKAADLRGILGYIVQFRQKVFVLNIDSAVLSSDNVRNLLLDISFLQSLSIKNLIVHGASAQLRTIAAQLRAEASDFEGTGITDPTTLRMSILAANELAHDILEGLSETDMRAAVSNAVVAHPAGIIGGIDHQWTGRVERVDVGLLQHLIDHDIIPIIPPLGLDGNGRTYRVNSDGVALEVSEALRADKLVHITTSNGVEGAGSLRAQFSVAEAEDYVRRRRADLAPGMLSKLTHGIRACRNGVARVHIIDGTQDDALLGEIFSNEGVGTMIYANEYEAIRQARQKDASVIRRLISPSVEAQQLVPRTRQEISARIHEFYVFEIDRNIVGCVGLKLYPESAPKLAELECLHVAEAHGNQGIGSKLMLYAEQKAREQGAERLVALSTQAFTFFEQRGGFREGTSSMLPPERRARYEQSGRRSKVLFKELV